MYRTLAPILAAVAFAGTVFAHSGVTNPKVMARMDGMVTLGSETKTLAQMARGQVAFDAEVAEAARGAMIEATRDVPVLFGPKERDPMDEAAPEIWTQWDAFVEHNDALEAVLIAADISSQEALAAALRDIGRACSACHEDYRIKR